MSICAVRMFVMSCLCVVGCYPAPDPRIFELMSGLRWQQQQIRRLQDQVNDGLTLALCNPELRQLLEDVQRECVSANGLCMTKQIKPAVIAADPEHRGRFLKLMSHFPHEVLYFATGSADVDPDRLIRLTKLARRALLKGTLFIVVSSSDSGDEEAVRRAQIVEGILHDTEVPTEKIKRWIYAFPPSKNDILRISDQPSIGETKELSRGVWVFRADC